MSPEILVRERRVRLEKRALLVTNLKKIPSSGSLRGPRYVYLSGDVNFVRPTGVYSLLVCGAAPEVPLERVLVSDRRKYDVGVLLLDILKQIWRSAERYWPNGDHVSASIPPGDDGW